jgi:hypothetical protein
MEKIGDQAVKISISVVSHAQIGLVSHLLNDIEEHRNSLLLELILTLNLDETLPFEVDRFSFPIIIIRNSIPLGFGANHNQAFTHASGQYFCVMNPDIRLNSDPFPPLLGCLMSSDVGVVAPLVLNENGDIEDSARRFPTPLKILCKLFKGCRGSDYSIGEQPIHPDWVGGMFMLFSREMFEKLRGFDPRYFLYYEDEDL